MEKLIIRLKKDFSRLDFQPDATFSWSPKERTIRYKHNVNNEEVGVWSLLHEIGHALLGHKDFTSDFELLQMEAAAWNKAQDIAQQYSYNIDNEHIQDCLDTYRDWLHKRSTCPLCSSISLQHDPTTYGCYNCNATWNVSRTRHCRPYRRLATNE